MFSSFILLRGSLNLLAFCQLRCQHRSQKTLSLCSSWLSGQQTSQTNLIPASNSDSLHLERHSVPESWLTLNFAREGMCSEGIGQERTGLGPISDETAEYHLCTSQPGPLPNGYAKSGNARARNAILRSRGAGAQRCVPGNATVAFPSPCAPGNASGWERKGPERLVELYRIGTNWTFFRSLCH